MSLKDPYVVAFLRGLFISFIVAGAVYFEADNEPLRAAGTAFFAAMIVRFGAEGAWDQLKNTPATTPRVAPPPDEYIIPQRPPPVAYIPVGNAVDFDKPYHRTGAGILHGGTASITECPLCIADTRA